MSLRVSRLQHSITEHFICAQIVLRHLTIRLLRLSKGSSPLQAHEVYQLQNHRLIVPHHSFGYYLGNYLSTNYVNRARGGRSTRSFINEGLWGQLLDLLVPGDLVVIEMGHNDNGTPGTGSDVGKDRAVIPGVGDETIVVTNSTGLNETVRTFGSYLRQMIVDVREKKGTPVLSGMVPTMSWTNNLILATNWPFTEYARTVGHFHPLGCFVTY